MTTRPRVREVLERLKEIKAEYPPDLLAARRGDFLEKVKKEMPRCRGTSPVIDGCRLTEGETFEPTS